MKIQPVRGTRDLRDCELYTFKHIQKVSDQIAYRYGYAPIETPIFEYTSVFVRTLGETSDMVGKEMYTFTDRGGESITLRPEGTASVVRSLLSEGLTQTLPQKRIYFGPMFRYERPQKGRYRQFYQLGIECLGPNTPFTDVEVMAFAFDILKDLGIKDFHLHINTLGDDESRKAYRQALIDYLLPYEKELSNESQIRLHKNPLRILDSKSEVDQKICEQAPKLENILNKTSREFFEKVCDGLSLLNIPYILDSHLVRGIDYYCDTVFEFKTNQLGAQDAILSGGRYNGLVEQMGGPSLPGVGWAAGVDRLALLMDQEQFKEPSPFVSLIPFSPEQENKALEICQLLRQEGFYVELLPSGSPGKRLKQAAKRQSRYALLLGEDEVKSNLYKLKDLKAHEENHEKEKTLVFSDLINYLNHNRN